jgi:hypothetical protein
VAIEAKKPGRRGEKMAGATQAQRDFLLERDRPPRLSRARGLRAGPRGAGAHLGDLLAEPDGGDLKLPLKQLRLTARIGGRDA